MKTKGISFQQVENNCSSISLGFHERQSPFLSMPNRGGSKARKPKKREESDNNIKMGFYCPDAQLLRHFVCILKINQRVLGISKGHKYKREKYHNSGNKVF